MRRKQTKFRFVLFAGAVLAVGGFVFLAAVLSPSRRIPEYGATFSIPYAESLQLDWRVTFLSMLEDLNIKRVRIPVYWSRVEIAPGQYDFSEIDWLMEESYKNGVDVTLVTGMKVPRWPECFLPAWASQTKEEYHSQVLMLVGETVARYKDYPALHRWQVENESFFPFGICPTADVRRVRAEVDLVRALDAHHPIQRTTSGEQSLWMLTSPFTDIIGASLYRTAYNTHVGYLVFPAPPFFYRIQAEVAGIFVSTVIVSELQAEPWFSGDPSGLTVEERYRLFTADDLRRNIDYANRTGVQEVFLWGIEWWYHLDMQGDSRLLDAGREVLNETYEGR